MTFYIIKTVASTPGATFAVKHIDRSPEMFKLILRLELGGPPKVEAVELYTEGATENIINHSFDELLRKINK